MKPLFIPLKTEFFEAFKNGTKDTEYCVYGPRWNENTCKEGRPVTLSKGYGKKHRLQGVIVAFDACTDPTMSAEWKRCYPPRIPRQVAAIIKIEVKNAGA
jgi:hypothetical protein